MTKRPVIFRAPFACLLIAAGLLLGAARGAAEPLGPLEPAVGGWIDQPMDIDPAIEPIGATLTLDPRSLALWLDEVRGIGCELEVVPCSGWERGMRWMGTGLPWVMPSPNLPTVDSCGVYPGMVLLEGTNLSEGRGTTRPFELFGAPWLDPHALAERLAGRLGEGVGLRPCYFEPTFQKHAGTLCGGGQLHVTDEEAFDPIRVAVEIIAAARELAPDDFQWRLPPYEYEERLMPIDLLWGHDGLRNGIEAGTDPHVICTADLPRVETFRESMEPFLIYRGGGSA